MLELEIVDHTSRFKEIEPEWLSFANTVPGLTPFQLPTWQLIWWKRFGSGELHIMVFRNRSLMVGVIPAFLHSWNNKRQMTLIGSGISDYLDPAISPSYCEAVVDCLRDHLHSIDYEVCDWQDLSGHSVEAVAGGRELHLEDCAGHPLHRNTALRELRGVLGSAIKRFTAERPAL